MFKVWIEIERQQEDGEYTPVGEPVDVCTTDTYEESLAVVRAVVAEHTPQALRWDWQRQGVFPYERQKPGVAS